MEALQTLPPLAAATLGPLQQLPPDAQLGELQLADQQAAGTLRKPAHIPVHQKHTASSRLHATVDPESDSAAGIRALLRRDRPSSPGATTLPPLGSGAVPADSGRHRMENMRELVAKKRQIFLAQMSLDTKHSEIAKLEQRAHQREEALMASEQALEQDSQRFEEYLKENDAKLQEALRRAEAEARARADKAAEAKRLAASIAGLKSEMAKIEEQLAECQKYKAFLDSVTPEEWFESVAAARQAKKAAMRDAWQAECDAIARHKQEAAAAKQRAEHDMQWARTQQQFERAERAHREAVAALREALTVQDPAEPDYGVVDEEEEDMHFQDPAQLLAVFSQLEGSNMFQIQAAQDAEQALEAARVAQAGATARLDAESAVLQRQVAELEGAIAASREHCAALRGAAWQNLEGGGRLPGAGTASGSTSTADSSNGAAGSGAAAAAAAASGAGGSQEAASLPVLLDRLAGAYEAAAFARDASVTPLQMLQKVEARLEEFLAAVGPPGGPAALAAEQVERAREKERRQVARADKLAAQQAEHEARIQRVLQRAAEPAFKKSGKPAMTRSVLQHEERSAGAQQDEDAEGELAAFLAMIDESIQ